MFRQWLDILQRTPNSILWMLRFPNTAFSSSQAEINLRQIALSADVDPSRLVCCDIVVCVSSGECYWVRFGRRLWRVSGSFKRRALLQSTSTPPPTTSTLWVWRQCMPLFQSSAVLSAPLLLVSLLPFWLAQTKR
mmetsp:Transcript_52609/g.114161  ORF Transcript_52609/g.114161 Transcript_52609/m.114161 type:complete len:135 (+) Transcript_52609:218-622(+)